MPSKRTATVLALIILNISLGLRGFWQEDRNFFTMHPFSDPKVQCTIRALDIDGNAAELPKQLYRSLPGVEFEHRLYLELLPLHAQGLTQYLQDQYPGATVNITCTGIHGDVPPTYRS